MFELETYTIILLYNFTSRALRPGSAYVIDARIALSGSRTKVRHVRSIAESSLSRILLEFFQTVCRVRNHICRHASL